MAVLLAGAACMGVAPAANAANAAPRMEVAANLGFAAHGHTVYITASTSIYRLPVRAPGETPLYAGE